MSHYVRKEIYSSIERRDELTTLLAIYSIDLEIAKFFSQDPLPKRTSELNIQTEKIQTRKIGGKSQPQYFAFSGETHIDLTQVRQAVKAKLLTDKSYSTKQRLYSSGEKYAVAVKYAKMILNNDQIFQELILLLPNDTPKTFPIRRILFSKILSTLSILNKNESLNFTQLSKMSLINCANELVNVGYIISEKKELDQPKQIIRGLRLSKNPSISNLSKSEARGYRDIKNLLRRTHKQEFDLNSFLSANRLTASSSHDKETALKGLIAKGLVITNDQIEPYLATKVRIYYLSEKGIEFCDKLSSWIS